MNPRRTRIVGLVLSAAFLCAPLFAAVQQRQPPAQQAVSSAPQKLVGKALYDKLRKEGRTLLKTEGQGQVLWTPDGKGYVVFEDKTFKRVDAETGSKTTLFDDAKIIAAYNAMTGKSVTELPFNRFTDLAGGRAIQFMALNRVFVYDRTTGKMASYEPEPQITGVRGRRYGDVLSPDLKYRAFTRDFNLYVKDMDGNETALTTDGRDDLRNGYPDWVYPEELGQYEAFWWSPDSKKIAFMQFDESPVFRYPIVHAVQANPRTDLQPYPTAGANNPIVRLFIADVATRKLVRLQTGDEADVYLYRGQWRPDGTEFTYHRLNRLQNHVEVHAADPSSGATRLLLADDDPCYIDETTELLFLQDNRRLLWTSERSGYREIYLYDVAGKLLRQLTEARLPESGIAGVDEASGWVYFSGYEARGTETHFYRVKLDGTGFARLTKDPGSHRVSLSPTAAFWADSFTSYTVPPRTTLRRADGSEVRVLSSSTPTADLEAQHLIAPEVFQFKSADGKYDLDGILYFPAHFDPASKYPVLLSVYGGPGSKGVMNTFKMVDPNQALAQLGFLVAACDYRGVTGRGKVFQNLHYLKLGQVELEDHVAFVKALAARPYVDATRVGVTGHSYGGYFTCLALLKAPETFQVGVAGAPVTDWRNYDSIYTERYMRRPQDNPQGYEQSSCLTFAKGLKGDLFIHHGAVDDNVHTCNTIELAQALLQANKRFDLMIYPEQQHGISFPRYPESRVEYFIEHLKPEVK